MATKNAVWVIFTLVKITPTAGRDFERIGETWMEYIPRVGEFVDFRQNPDEDDQADIVVREVIWKLPRYQSGLSESSFVYQEFQTVEIFVGPAKE